MLRTDWSRNIGLWQDRRTILIFVQPRLNFKKFLETIHILCWHHVECKKNQYVVWAEADESMYEGALLGIKSRETTSIAPVCFNLYSTASPAT